jgi:hypothetical protein
MKKRVNVGIYLTLAMGVVFVLSAILHPAQAESRLFGFTSTPTVGTTVTDTFIPPSATVTTVVPTDAVTPTPEATETPTEPPPTDTPQPTKTREDDDEPTPVPTATHTPTDTPVPTVTPEPPTTGGLVNSSAMLWLGLLAAILVMGLLVARLAFRKS